MTISESFVKKFRIRLETLSPIHVGGDDRLDGFDYVIYGDVVHVVDTDKLFNSLMSRGLLERYLQFVSGRFKRKLLSDFLNSVGMYNESFLRSVTAYTIRCNKGLGLNGRAVKVFIRGLNNSLYLPGSSLKGSLRTAIILSYLVDDEMLRSKVVVNYKARNPGVVVENVLRSNDSDFGSDLLRLLKPSDLFPLSAGVVGEVAKLSSLSFITGNSRVHGFLEVVPPGVVFEGFVRVLDDPRVIKYVGRRVDLDKFIYAIRARSKRLLDRLLNRLINVPGSGVAEVRRKLGEVRSRLEDGDVLTTVGFGQGYWGVTVTEFKPELVRSLRIRGYRGPDFPSSMRVVDRGVGLEPLGWVLLRFEEVGG